MLVLQESSPFEFRVILSDNTTPQDHCERWSTNRAATSPKPANDSQKIIIDLEKLEYINSSGLNVILNIFTRIRNANGELVICHVNEKLQKLLVITKLHDIIKQTNSRKEAATFLASEN